MSRLADNREAISAYMEAECRDVDLASHDKGKEETLFKGTTSNCFPYITYSHGYKAINIFCWAFMHGVPN